MNTPVINFYDYHPPLANLQQEVVSGLSQHPKTLSPKFFYDEMGSKLFDAITELPEYYPSRTEIKILQQHGDEMAELLGKGCLLLELGSGSSQKIRTLLDVLQPAAYVPMDISKEHLIDAASRLAIDYPELDIHASCADYSGDFELPYCPEKLPRAAFFPGSSIGNFEPTAAQNLLGRVAQLLGSGSRLLIGVDLEKQQDLLYAAYNDAQGVTAEFNLNVLRRINRELSADFELGNFSHEAVYNNDEHRVEMHLFSDCRQTVEIDKQFFDFAEGESIHTESSYKYTPERFQQLAKDAGYELEKTWIDEDSLFSVHCLRAI